MTGTSNGFREELNMEIIGPWMIVYHAELYMGHHRVGRTKTPGNVRLPGIIAGRKTANLRCPKKGLVRSGVIFVLVNELFYDGISYCELAPAVPQ